MAVEIEEFIKKTLGRLPPDHPDRGFLEGQAQVFTSFNARVTEAKEQKLNPDYLRTVEVLKKAGLTVFPIEPKSLDQMAVDEDGKGYFDYIAPSETLRKVVPEAATVAIDTQQITIPNSNNKDQARQIEMIRRWGKKLKQRTGLTDKDILVRMPHVSEASQLDIVYQRVNQGKKLYPDFWVRTLDKMVGPYVAAVGRSHPVLRLDVSDWNADDGHPLVWASPVVVILHGKLKIG